VVAAVLSIAKIANIAKDRRNSLLSTQTACPTGVQFGFFGNYQFWQLFCR
jgi:hypothetical protein